MLEECTNNPSIVVSPPQKRRRINVKWKVIQTFPDMDAYKKWLDMKAPAEQVVRGPLHSTEDEDKCVFKCTYSNKRGGNPALTSCWPSSQGGQLKWRSVGMEKCILISNQVLLLKNLCSVHPLMLGLEHASKHASMMG